MITSGSARLLHRSGLRHLARHKWQAALALVGIMLGVAIVVAVDLATTASRQSFEAAAAELRGNTTHRLVNPAGDIDEAIYRTLATTPGHPPMAPVITARVSVAGRSGRIRLVGLDVFSEAMFRTVLGEAVSGQQQLGQWLSRPGAAVLSRSAATELAVQIGDTLEVSHEGRPYRLEILSIHPDTSSASADLLIVDIATAQALTGRNGRISHIDLRLDDARRAWFETRFGDALPAGIQLVDARSQAEGIAGMSAAFELNLAAMSLLALFVGLFLIYNAMSFSIVQRRNLFGRLRALGVTPSQLFRQVMFEAGALAAIGSIAGVLFGAALGQALLQVVSTTVSSLYYDTVTTGMALPATSLAKGTILGLCGTLLAAWFPARLAAATPPLTTMSRSRLELATRRQVPAIGLAGLALAGSGLLIALVLPGGVVIGFAGLFLLLLGAAMATPLALRLVHRLPLAHTLPGVLRMAWRDLDRHLSRLATAKAALMIALAASISVAVMVESMRSSVANWLESLLNADLYVSSASFADNASLPPGADLAASTLPGVDGFSLYRHTDLIRDGQPLALVAVALHPRSRQGFRFIAGQATAAWAAFDAGAVLVSEPLAYRLALGPGDRLSLPTAAGPREFAIAGVFQDYASERGRVFIDLAVYRSHWQDERTDTVALFALPGQVDELLRSARERLSARFDLAFTDAQAIYAESMRIFDRTFRITEVLRQLSLLVAFVGVFSALMAIQLERRREYAVLRALGFTPGQLAWLILLQAGLLGLLAGLVAIPTGLAMAWILTDAIQQRAFGWSMAYVVTASPLLMTLWLGVAAALLAGIYPAWRGAREHPAPQMRED